MKDVNSGVPHPHRPLGVRLRTLLYIFGGTTIVLGFFGLWGAHAERDIMHRLSAVLFDVAGLFVLEKPHADVDNAWLSVARVTAIATSGMGLFLILAGVFRDGVAQWRLRVFGRRAAGGRKPLNVICGLGRIGRQLVDDLTTADLNQSSVVAIEIDAGNPGIETAREAGAVVVIGDARDAAVRRRARMSAADRVFVVCGDDSINLDTAAEVVRDVDAGRAGTSRLLHCYANVVSPTLAKAAHDNPVFAELHGRMRFETFNVVESSARQLVKDELGRRHAPHRGEVAHYVLFGFGAMGQTVALLAGRMAHFENNCRLRMSIIDDWEEPVVRKARRCFLERHPAFCPDPDTFDLEAHVSSAFPERDAWFHRAGRPANPGWRIDAPVSPTGEPIPIEYVVNAEFLDLGTEVDAPPLIAQLISRLKADQSPPVRPCVIVCFDDDRRNLEGALRVSAALRSESLDLPLYVYLPDEPGLATFLRRGREQGVLGDVLDFGACEVSAAYSEIVQPNIVELAKSFREAYDRQHPSAQPARSTLARAFWASDYEAAHHVEIKRAAADRMRAAQDDTAAKPVTNARFTPTEREALACMEHNRYVAERLLAGWRYGPSNNAAKRRESLIPWNYLPEKERVKDFEQIDVFAQWLDGRDSAKRGNGSK
ncbi:MAG: NAD-binding protein [Ectothiorhodospiraceae bacterium]|nr:NAD-binding protein [Ectothiorhodospiraceae bacterium]